MSNERRKRCRHKLLTEIQAEMLVAYADLRREVLTPSWKFMGEYFDRDVTSVRRLVYELEGKGFLHRMGPEVGSTTKVWHVFHRGKCHSVPSAKAVKIVAEFWSNPRAAASVAEALDVSTPDVTQALDHYTASWWEFLPMDQRWR